MLRTVYNVIPKQLIKSDYSKWRLFELLISKRLWTKTYGILTKCKPPYNVIKKRLSKGDFIIKFNCFLVIVGNHIRREIIREAFDDIF